MARTECTTQITLFEVGTQDVTVDFEGGQVVTDAGLLAVRKLDLELGVIAGPCSVENREMLFETAHAVRGAGAGMLRGGAFKPRSSPYAFQGLGETALRLLAEVRAETGMPVVTEVMDTRQVELVAEHADVLQIGARNMQNFSLLSEVGKVQRPVLLKRGLSATIKELLMAAEYVMAQGNRDVILCDRGIRTYEHPSPEQVRGDVASDFDHHPGDVATLDEGEAQWHSPPTCWCLGIG